MRTLRNALIGLAVLVTPAHALTQAPTACQTASTTALPSRSGGYGYFIAVNNSDTDIYVDAAGGPASTTGGFLLKAGGGAWIHEATSPRVPSLTCIHASSGTKALVVLFE